MKRTLLSILVIGILLLSACGAPTAPAPAIEAPPIPSPAEQPAPGEKELPSNAISWNEAKYHIGERTIVCGPVVDTKWASGSKGKPTFLNIGKPYPDPNRFTIVIWIQNRGKFSQPPEDYYLGKNICVTGLVQEYPKGSGSPQIEAKDPSQIEVQ